MKSKSVTVLSANYYEPIGNFSRDLYLFLEQIEYEPNELSKELLEEMLRKRGIRLRFFDFIFGYCERNKLIDVRTRTTGTRGIKISGSGIEELRQLRARRLSELQTELLERQSVTNNLIAFGTIVLAIMASTQLPSKQVSVFFAIAAVLIWGMTLIPKRIKQSLRLNQ